MLSKYHALLYRATGTSSGFRVFQMGAPTPDFVAKTYYLARFFAENYMKMKEIGTREGRVPSAPLDSPMGIL